MDNIIVEIHHGDRCLEYLQEAGYGNGLKLYYNKPDHCSEEKGKNVVDELNFVDDGPGSNDPGFEEEEYSDSDHSKYVSDDDINGKDAGVESDIDEELEEKNVKRRAD
ncbi:hypothetical protein POM88_037473 [Heracleum sosnowskyi]|uniref:Uncharacterized protein n=1 Tax=Heracleum sosnowskyi TaxID=360622 RepID=A0AAD8HR75_9APIA|nr:hypothetical protein POM88_037473 [Heracleum sosnowskyi]